MSINVVRLDVTLRRYEDTTLGRLVKSVAVRSRMGATLSANLHARTFTVLYVHDVVRPRFAILPGGTQQAVIVTRRFSAQRGHGIGFQYVHRRLPCTSV